MIETLIDEAHRLGAGAAAVISTGNIVVDDSLAERCREPKCENFGLSKSCPPHVSGPVALRKKLEKFSQALVFKIELPSEILYSSERREWFQLLHETAAGIEQYAVNMGFENARGYAGGSCKKIFCHDHPECRVLSKKGECRNPKYARSSMSGFGINVAKLVEAAGWTMNWPAPGSDETASEMANIYGLVLIC